MVVKVQRYDKWRERGREWWILDLEFPIFASALTIETSDRMHPIHLIVNPHSAKGRTGRIADTVIEWCAAKKLDLIRMDTSGARHATELACSLDGRARIIAVLGGDGTLNEVVNGVQGKETILALLPSGTGNDFAKVLGIASARAGVEALAAGRVRLVDLARVSIDTASGANIERLFINAVGIGFDAAVAYRVARVRFGRGMIPYLVGVLATLRSYRGVQASIRIGDTVRNTSLFLACFGNGRSSGGGFALTPRAEIDDGMLDLCYARDMKVWRVLQVLPKALSGTHLSAPEVGYERLSTAEIRLDAPLPVHADGELLTQEALRVRVSVLPGAQRFIAG